MSDNKNLPQKKDSAEVALQKTTSLLSITNKILANRANRTLVVSEDAWLDELIAWADENEVEDYHCTAEEDYSFIPEYKWWHGFPRDKQTLLNLTWLDLGYGFFSKVIELPESIGKLTKLTELNFNCYELTKLPESIGKLTNLTELDISQNRLTKLPESIGKLTNLTVLDLWGNQLTELPESINKLTNLTHLNLWGNQFTELPDSIGKLTNLKKLSLGGNPIKSLSAQHSHLRNITTFD